MDASRPMGHKKRAFLTGTMMLTILSGLFLVGVLVIFEVASNAAHQSRDLGVMLQIGEQGNKINIFSWPRIVEGAAPKVRKEEFKQYQCIQKQYTPPLYKIASQLEKIDEVVESMIECVDQVIPERDRQDTSVFIFGTESMRSISSDDQRTILNRATKFVQDETQYYFKDSWARTIGLKEEAQLTWIGTNFMRTDFKDISVNNSIGVTTLDSRNAFIIFSPNDQFNEKREDLSNHNDQTLLKSKPSDQSDHNHNHNYNNYLLQNHIQNDDHHYKYRDNRNERYADPSYSKLIPFDQGETQITVRDEEYHLYVKLFHNFGSSVSHKRYIQLLAANKNNKNNNNNNNNNNDPISDPCLATGHHISWRDPETQSLYTIIGNSDFDQCQNFTWQSLRYNCPDCDFQTLVPLNEKQHAEFVGMNAYYELAQIFAVENQIQSLDSLEPKISDLCSLEWVELLDRYPDQPRERLAESCFKGVLILTLSQEGFDFPSELKLLNLTTRLGDRSSAWREGVMIHESDRLTHGVPLRALYITFISLSAVACFVGLVSVIVVVALPERHWRRLYDSLTPWMMRLSSLWRWRPGKIRNRHHNDNNSCTTINNNDNNNNNNNGGVGSYQLMEDE